MTAWDFLNSAFGLLFSGFVLSTILGAILSAWLQRASWMRQTRVELFRNRYQEGVKFLDDLSELIGRRYFNLQKYLWAVEDPDAYDLPRIADAYFDIVAEWNAKLRMNRNKIRLLIGEPHANAFLDYQDDSRPDSPQSLHYVFIRAGQSVSDARDRKISLVEAQFSVDKANWTSSGFLENLTTEFLRRASALELLKIPDDVLSVSEEQK